MAYTTLGDYFNPGQVLTQAEQIKTQQQQRALNQQMAPYELQMAQLRPQQAELQIEQAKKNLMQTGSNVLDDKTFTEKDALKLLTFGTPEQKNQAQKYLDKYIGLQEKLSNSRYGELTPEAVDFYADKVLVDPSYISKFSSRSSQRSQIANAVQAKAAATGQKVPDLTLKNAQLNATTKSFNKQKTSFDGDLKISDEFLTDVNRVKQQINNLRTNYPSYANLGIRKLRELSASGKLGQESVLQQELDALMQSYGRLTLDASSSISEMSAGAQERYQKLLNSNAPAFVLIQQLENFEKSLKDRIGARGRSLTRLESQIKEYSSFGKDKEKETTQNKKMVFNPSTGRFE